MNKYRVVTDSTCDLPLEYIRANLLGAYPLKVNISGENYLDDLGQSLPTKVFFDRLRAGETASTSQLNPSDLVDAFSPILEDGFDILYIAFSSGLSGCYASASPATAELNEKYPDRRIVTIDSKCASLGEGLLVDLALEKQAAGATLDELADYVENLKMHIAHFVTVDSLAHLQRGGRVSKTAAFFGTLAGIKVMIHVNDDGKLVPVGKVRGRIKAIEQLADKVKEHAQDPAKNKLFISHGDCLDDVNLFVKMLQDRKVKFKETLINPIGAVIGAHAGPGTIAIFFVAENRTY